MDSLQKPRCLVFPLGGKRGCPECKESLKILTSQWKWVLKSAYSLGYALI